MTGSEPARTGTAPDVGQPAPRAAPGRRATLIPTAPTGAESAKAALPLGATWSPTGIGRTALPGMLAALSAGGYLRVGMGDTVTIAGGRLVASNAELVARAAALADLAQRPADARAMLGVSHRG